MRHSMQCKTDDFELGNIDFDFFNQISTTDGSMEPSKKIQRTFPPPDIRNEALSVPFLDKTQPTSQIDSQIDTNSSITIEAVQPAIDITKPKVNKKLIDYK